ncbi:NAD(P)H dehydrogenase (quinone) [Amorphus suaedae]
MSTSNRTILVTGASGALGRLVVQRLLALDPGRPVVAAARRPEAVDDLVRLGAEALLADYERPDTLARAFEGVHTALLVSSSEIGKRVAQHRNVIEAARAAGVSLIAYTSLLRADTSPLALGREHSETEALLRASGVPFVLLRNGWYTENYLASVPAALQHGALFGAAGEGRIASAARADYADAAAAVLAAEADQAGRTYELAGDTAYTLTELAAEISRQTGREIPYRNLTPEAYEQALLGAGLPAPVASLLADSDAGAAAGGLYDDSGDLRGLIGRPTTSMAEMVAAAVKTADAA